MAEIMSSSSVATAVATTNNNMNDNNNIENKIPAIMNGKGILIPIKIDLMHSGARLVDTFCWNIDDTLQDVELFAARTCADLSLPVGFAPKISAQITEQIEAYEEVLSLLEYASKVVPRWDAKVQELQTITVGIRHNTLDFSDKFTWDPMDGSLTPEEFAHTTCLDVGLPMEMAPVISYKIRETLFRWIIDILEHPDAVDVACTGDFKVTDLKVTLVPSNTAVDMVTNLWRRAKPNSVEESAAVPQPLVPEETSSNASVWIDSK